MPWIDLLIVIFLACWFLGSLLVFSGRFQFLVKRRWNPFSLFARWRLFVPHEKGVSRSQLWFRDGCLSGNWSEWQKIDLKYDDWSFKHMVWCPQRYKNGFIRYLSRIILERIERQGCSMEEIKGRGVEAYLRLEHYVMAQPRIEENATHRQFKIRREYWKNARDKLDIQEELSSPCEFRGHDDAI